MWRIFKKVRIPNKIEFIEKTEVGSNGVRVYYYTQKNGYHVSNSLHYDKQIALGLFDKIKNGIPLESEKVLETKYL